jgi:hypothetical protein
MKRANMSKSKSHNFWINFNAISKDNSPTSLYLFYKYGNESKRIKKLPIKLNPSDWDRTKKAIRPTKELNNKEASQYLRELESKLVDIKVQMFKGDISINTAWDLIFDKNPEGSIQSFIENDLKLTTASRTKFLNYLSGLSKHLPSKYSNLHYVNIQDETSINEIASILKESSLKNSTVSDYLGMLDYVSRAAKLKVQSPFAGNKLKPVDDESDKLPRSVQDIIQGMQGINTKKDFYAINFWLYSFCLRGLGGADICNLNESLIKGAKYTLPYYPDYAIDSEYYSTLSEKSYIYLRRGKKKHQKSLSILINTFPTFLLHQSLKQLIKEEYPEIAYKGSDKLRLFNFTTKDKDYNDILEGKKKWSLLRDTVSKKCSKLIGAGLHNTRHTFTASGNSYARLNDNEQRELLGQKTKGALKHYQSEAQIKTDLNHLHILDDFRIVVLTRVLFQLGIQKGYITKELSTGAVDLLSQSKLLTFSPEDELKLQQLKKDWELVPIVEVIDGNITTKPSPKPKELIQLERRKSSLLVVGDVDISTEKVASGLVFSFISKEEKDRLIKEELLKESIS